MGSRDLLCLHGELREFRVRALVDLSLPTSQALKTWLSSRLSCCNTLLELDSTDEKALDEHRHVISRSPTEQANERSSWRVVP